jgi:hypothetical protein
MDSLLQQYEGLFEHGSCHYNDACGTVTDLIILRNRQIHEEFGDLGVVRCGGSGIKRIAKISRGVWRSGEGNSRLFGNCFGVIYITANFRTVFNIL